MYNCPNLDENVKITPIISRRLESIYKSNNKIQIKKYVSLSVIHGFYKGTTLSHQLCLFPRG